MAKIIDLPATPNESKSKSGARIITINPSDQGSYGPQLRVKSEGVQGPTPAESNGGTTPGSDVFNAFIGRLIPSGLATAGGQFGGPIGGLAGSAAGEGLRQLLPSLFGGKDSGDVGTDALNNAVIPGAIGETAKLMSAGPRQYTADLLSSGVGKKIPAVKNLVDASDDFAKQAELDYRQKIFGKTNPMASDPNVQTPSGFTTPEPNLDQVKGIIQKAQEGAKDIKNPLLRYARNSLVFRLGAMAGIGGLSPTAAVAGSSLVLGNAAIKQLTSNPETAQLLIKAINTAGDDEQSAFVGKTLMNALRGTSVIIRNSDGDNQPAIIDDKGQLVYKK